MGLNLDAEIAEKLFGLPVEDNRIKLGGKRRFIPPYSMLASSVVDILEALRKKGFTTITTYGTEEGVTCVFCTVVEMETLRTFDGEAETLPLALCKAALKALEGK
jgi:hypothetical protein